MINWKYLQYVVDAAPEKESGEKEKVTPKIRRRIVKRDVVCKICGGSNKLHAHHIRPKGLATDENLALLCKSCHQTVHCLLYVLGKCNYVNVLGSVRWQRKRT